jgi:hypothetical protein
MGGRLLELLVLLKQLGYGLGDLRDFFDEPTLVSY